MSVIVKGMEMPEKCGSCDLFHAESPMHCTVVKGHKTVGAPYGMPRPEWCPLIETDDSTGWMPCSKRLPEDGTAVLTTIHIPGRRPKVRSGHFKYGMFMNDNGDTWNDSDKEVVAWMPLPHAFNPKEDK